MRLVAILGAVAALSCSSKPPPHASQTFQVEIRGMQFAPASLHVQPGDLVVWTNRDLVPHTATSTGWFDSGPIAPGQHWSYAVTQRTALDYVCTFHPTMKGQLLAQ